MTRIKNKFTPSHWCFQSSLISWTKWLKEFLNNFIWIIVRHEFYIVAHWVRYTLFFSIFWKNKVNCNFWRLILRKAFRCSCFKLLSDQQFWHFFIINFRRKKSLLKRFLKKRYLKKTSCRAVLLNIQNIYMLRTTICITARYRI